MPTKSSRPLIKFLGRYSTSGVRGNIYKLYRQWTLVEVRDAGRKDNLVCPCGRSGLRYLCFIRNRRTRIQTYVGSTCIRHFSNRTVPALLNLLESLSKSGITGRYVGRKGKFHRFRIRRTANVVRHFQLLRNFFRKVPVRRCGRAGWEISVIKSPRFAKPKLRRGKYYNIKIGPVTSGSRRKPRPALVFFADRIRRAGI